MSNRSFNFIKVEGKATSQRYEGSAWNDLRQALEKMGMRWEFPFWKRRMISFRYGISFRALAKKTALILLENAQWFDAVSLEKSETTRGAKKPGEMATDFYS